jgi:hypothetical protein
MVQRLDAARMFAWEGAHSLSVRFLKAWKINDFDGFWNTEV